MTTLAKAKAENGASPYFEVRESDFGGMGMWATTGIPAGTRIICEDAAVILPDGADYPDLYRLVDALPPQKQAGYWALAAYNRKHEVDWIPAVRAAYQGLSPQSTAVEYEDRSTKPGFGRSVGEVRGALRSS